MGGEEEEEELKGHTINVDLFVTLKDLYVGREFKVGRGSIKYKGLFVVEESRVIGGSMASKDLVYGRSAEWIGERSIALNVFYTDSNLSWEV